MFAVYVDVKYENKGVFTPDVLRKSHSLREFIGYIVVAEDSLVNLTINGTLRDSIYVVVFPSFVFARFSITDARNSIGIYLCMC